MKEVFHFWVIPTLPAIYLIVQLVFVYLRRRAKQFLWNYYPITIWTAFACEAMYLADFAITGSWLSFSLSLLYWIAAYYTHRSWVAWKRLARRMHEHPEEFRPAKPPENPENPQK